MSNVFSLKKLRNNPGYNGFDLSRKNLYTASIGELLPVATIECLPDDKFDLGIQHFTRTRPVNTAAFTRIREYYDWFFVPTNLLWNKFNTFVTQMTDNNQHANSIVDSQTIGGVHPYFTHSQLTAYLDVIKTKKTPFGYLRSDTTAKLLDYLGYGYYYDFGVSNVVTGQGNDYLNNVTFNPFPLLAYQKIYSDYFRDSQWEQAYAPMFNIDYAGSSSLPISNLYSASAIDNPNMFDLHYCNWNKDYFMGVKPNSQYGAAASVNLSSQGSLTFGSTSYALLGKLYSSTSVYDGNANYLPAPDSPIPSTFPSALTRTGWNDGLSFAISASGVERLRSSMNLSPTANISSSLTILALRQAQAKQRWAEITQSVGQDYKSQIEAHWGKEVSDAYSEKCKWIDGDVSTIDISAVENTNLADSNSQASIAGKGVGTGESKTNFTAPCHGILMCIYHAVPLLDYQITGVEKFNLKSKVTDYAIPEMDKTGMVSVPFIELLNRFDPEWNITNKTGMANSYLGYAPLYYEYKSSYDTVRGGFRFDNGYASWVAPVDSEYLAKYFNQFASSGRVEINYWFFKVNPSFLNNIFDMDYDGKVQRDQFFINCAFDIKAARKLDYNGLPM